MLVLHIGLPKTATTFLQYSIFKHQHDIRYVHNPRDTSPDAVERLLKLYQRADAHDLPPLIERIAAALPASDTLISNENISIRPQEVWTGSGPPPTRAASRLVSLADQFGGLKVVLGIRRQDQWLGSRYAQSAKTHPEFGQHDFERRVQAVCDQPLEGALGWLDYGVAHAALADGLGPDNVLLVPSEMLEAEPDETLARLGDGLSCPGLVSAYRKQAAKDSPRRNALSIGRNRWRLPNHDEAVTMPDWLGDRVLKRFADGNRAAAERSGLDLGSYGYL